MIHPRRTLSALLAAISLAAAAHAQVFRNITYAPPGLQPSATLLDVYKSQFPLPGRPTVIVLFGGGYTSGSKADVASTCQTLAAYGFNAVAPNYSLTTSAFASSPQAMIDTMSVVRWVRTQGQSYGLNQSIVLSGFSAGATISAAAGLASIGPTFTPPPLPAGVANPRLKVDMVVGFFGRYDLVWNGQFSMPGYVYQFIGATATQPHFPAACSLASATTYADLCSPPTALYHGGADTVVPPTNTTRLAQALQARGAQVRLTIQPGGGHGIDLNSAAFFIIDAVEELIGTGCDPAPDSIGACCRGLTCSRTFDTTCFDGDFIPATTCQPNTCLIVSGAGACCVDSSCFIALPQDCAGSFVPTTLCAPALCTDLPPQLGACCWGVTCALRSQSACIGPGRIFHGIGVACNPPGNLRTICCAADFDQNGQSNIDDIFIYLNAWFASSPSAALTPGGVPNIDDIFRFLNAWFAGC